MDALGENFSSHPMHAYFTPQSNGTTLVFNRAKGRHVLAARAIPTGVAVFRMESYAAVVKDPYVSMFCHHCQSHRARRHEGMRHDK